MMNTHPNPIQKLLDLLNRIQRDASTSTEDDITTYDINDILRSEKFTPEERAAEYRRRGNSPSGVIDGVYNDEWP
jgi:hypothetical protein